MNVLLRNGFFLSALFTGILAQSQSLRKMDVISGEPAISPDSKIVGVFDFAQRRKDSGQVAFYDFSTGELLSTLPNVWTTFLAFSPDHRRVLLCNGLHDYLLYDLTDERHPKILARDVSEPIIDCGAISPDGKIYALGFDNGQIAGISTETGKSVYVHNVFSPPSNDVSELAFTAANNLVFYNFYKGFIVFDAVKSKTIFTIPFSSSYRATTHNWSSKTNTLLLGTDDAVGRVYDLASGNVLSHFTIPGYDRSYYSPDGAFGIGLEKGKLAVYKISGEKRKKIGSLALDAYGIDKAANLRRVIYSLDGKWFAVSVNGNNSLLIGSLEEMEKELSK